MATFPSMEWLLELVFGNMAYILPVVAIGFFILTYLTVKGRSKIKPIDRADIERKLFIERMKLNAEPTKHFKFFRRGKKVIGKITHYASGKIEGFKDNPHPTTKLLVKPVWTPLKIPFGKTICIVVDNGQLVSKQEKGHKEGFMSVPAHTHFDNSFGIYYNKEDEMKNRTAIIHDGILRQDLNNLASVYFAKSQEQATFDPDHAHQLAMREKEIQLEMSKRRGQLTQI